MKKKITSLEELEKEQQRLEMLMEVTRNELAQSLGTNRKELRNFLLARVVMPLGIIGLTTGLGHFSKTKNKTKSGKMSISAKALLSRFLPIGLRLFKKILAQELYTDSSEEDYQRRAESVKLKKVV